MSDDSVAIFQLACAACESLTSLRWSDLFPFLVGVMPMIATNSSILDPLDFVATDVTGLKRMRFQSVDGHRPASDVATSVATAMDLSTDVPWSLRDETHARMLDQNAPLGGQIDADAELVVIPRSHLG